MSRPTKTDAEKCMNRAEIAGVLWACKAAGNPQAYALFALQYLLGMRIGEAILLQYGDLGSLMKDGWPVCVRVPTLKRKGKGPRDARMPVPVLSAPSLIRWAFSPKARPAHLRNSHWLFPSAQKGMGHHVTRSWAMKTFKKMAREGNVDTCFSTHAVRHSAGSHLFETCGQMSLVSRFLRHSGAGKWSVTGGAAVTERYVHVTPQTWARHRGCLDFAQLQPVPYDPGSPARDLFMGRNDRSPTMPKWRT